MWKRFKVWYRWKILTEGRGDNWSNQPALEAELVKFREELEHARPKDITGEDE